MTIALDRSVKSYAASSPALPAECLRAESARITPQPDGTFWWGGEVDALCLPVAGPETWDAPELGPIFDNVIAWRPEAPGRWWLEVNDWPLLGWQALQQAAAEGGSLVLFPTPAAWAASGGRGACILRWTIDPLDLFAGVASVQCADAATERRLRAEVERWAPFKITRAGAMRGKAAA